MIFVRKLHRVIDNTEAAPRYVRRRIARSVQTSQVLVTGPSPRFLFLALTIPHHLTRKSDRGTSHSLVVHRTHDTPIARAERPPRPCEILSPFRVPRPKRVLFFS
jgi:hypothetical protein